MKKTFLIISLLTLTLIFSGCNRQETPTGEVVVDQSPSPAVSPTVATPVTDAAGPGVEQPITREYGEYIPYSDQAFDEADNTFRVLFFHASWCPTCKAADEDFTTNIEDIPTNVTILKTDYDTETGLKDQYGITYQHTFVLLDKDGSVMDTWNGGGLDELKQHLTVF